MRRSADDDGGEGEAMVCRAAHGGRLGASTDRRKREPSQSRLSELMARQANPRLKSFDAKLFGLPAALRGQQARICMPNLFDSLHFGSLELPNRIVMAPLTRARAGREGVP